MMQASFPHSINRLLQLRGPEQDVLHRAAARFRDEQFSQSIHVRGVVEISNYCRQSCNYCGMRKENKALKRKRTSAEEVFNFIVQNRPDSVADINIQAGEDPVAVRDIALPLIRMLREQTDLGISVCLGTLSPREYDSLREAGADFYILKLETGDPQHYREIQAPGTLEKRIQAIRYLASTGWKVSSGFILGLPFQTEDHISKSLELLAELPLAGCSVSPFIPGDSTPFKTFRDGDLEAALNCVAIMRHMTPHRIIPAVSAFGLVGNDGYNRAFRAGANLATINLTPSEYRKDYVIYKRDRLIIDEQKVLQAIHQSGCHVNTTGICKSLDEESVSA